MQKSHVALQERHYIATGHKHTDDKKINQKHVQGRFIQN